MITITVTQDNKTLTLTQPSDIPLTATNDSYYSWKHVFANILFWLTFPPDTINSVIPDCEECDTIEELNREHNAELEEKCERCEYKQSKTFDLQWRGEKEPPIITDEVEKETVKNCDNCQYGHTEQLSAECFGCVEAKTQVLTHWQPVSANDETTGKSEI